MHKGHTVAALGTALLGITLAASASYGDARGPNARSQRPATAEPGRTFRVDEQVSRPLENGCRYDATVRGTVREMRVDGARTAEARYVPRLAVDAQLACAEGLGTHRSREVTPVPDYSRAQLESELELRGRVFSAREGAICTFRPDVEFSDGRVTVRGVTGSCAAQPPRGGGPTAPGTRTRGEATSGHSFRMSSRDGHDVVEYVDFEAHGSVGR